MTSRKQTRDQGDSDEDSAAPRRVSARSAPSKQPRPPARLPTPGRTAGVDTASRHCRADRSPHLLATQRAHPGSLPWRGQRWTRLSNPIIDFAVNRRAELIEEGCDSVEIRNTAIGQEMLMQVAFLKHSNFEEEKEVRVAVQGYPNHFTPHR
jgi:hypothetical protein